MSYLIFKSPFSDKFAAGTKLRPVHQPPTPRQPCKQKRDLFIRDTKPLQQAHFNVFTAPRKGQPWGAFSTETVVPVGHTGPCYEESSAEEHDHATKISNTNEPHKAILLGRLRFKPDSLEPTTAK